MYEIKKNEKVFTSKFVGTGPSSYEKRIYRAAVSQRLRNTGLENNVKVHRTCLTFILPAWVFKFQGTVYEKHEDYLNRKRENCEIKGILLKTEQAMQQS